MIADLKPYAEYKESGQPWLGRVPKHWEVRRLKSAVSNIVEQATQMNSDDVYIALENVESWTGRVKPQKGVRLFTSQVKRFRSNDVLFGKLRPYLAKVTRLQRGGVCVGELIVLRPRDQQMRPDYLEHQLRSRQLIDIINSSTFGAKMPRADWQFMGNLPIVFPPLPEQVEVARFLDWANGRLEGAIRAKQKVIALLNEQKQAIIHRAVTRGLDANVRLKPSGVPWIGDVPAHWSLTPNRTFLRIRKLLVGIRHSEYKLLSLTKSGVVVRDVATGGKFSNFWGRSQEVRPGDLVFCFFDVEETPRTVGLSKHFGMISGDYTVMECADPLCAAFVECFYMAMDDRKLLSPLYSGLRKRIPKPEFLSVVTPIPPRDEQVAIVRNIKESLSSTEQSAEQIRHEVRLLAEYRTRLVADVVTGKLDVREATTRLPEEATPHTPEHEADLSDEIESADEEAVV
jgi:type I restriction enzyme S subunit